MISFLLPLGPTIAVLNSNASSGVIAGSPPPTNSENEGPVFNLSLKRVGFLREVESVAEGSEVAVANVRRVVGEEQT